MLSSYEELNQYIIEDFDEFLNEGLSISQVTEKLLEEYYRGIVNGKVEKLVIYLRIALLSIERNHLREDIKTELMSMINELESIPTKEEVGSENAKQILLDIQRFKKKSKDVNEILLHSKGKLKLVEIKQCGV
ncbi:hypothetical protein FC756_24050 [Lysinibacillus mangiferihumi]|uniref:Uncharacterized protein n=1 Tax=Lysinibacillus mangiferihumi TaxID=1130819 RepID=A0A4U2XZJ3_9BACI|nr:Imm3 family immunity protein [Lysinibacillus mangiferihumi]TKI53420.1 hypothetical protein FC756_24050 [Lysinibacillus mangiferihumi]